MAVQDDIERLYNSIGAHITPGKSAPLTTPPVCNTPIFDTELAACLVTLGVPFRQPVPFTESIENEGERRVRTWWLGDRSESGHVTEDILGGYYQRDRMERDHPLHPMVPMRAAIDARKFWLSVKFGEFRLPTEGNGYATPSLRAASILKAHKFAPVAFTGRAFILQSFNNGMPCAQLLEMAERTEGAQAPQWMRKVLMNLDEMLAHMKRGKGSEIVRTQEGNRSMLLTVDSKSNTVDKFQRLL